MPVENGDYIQKQVHANLVCDAICRDIYS